MCEQNERKQVVNVKKYEHDDKMFVIDEATLQGDGMTLKEVCDTLIYAFNIKYFYNCNFINRDNERITWNDILKHTHINAIRKGRRTCNLAASNNSVKSQLEVQFKSLQKYVSQQQQINNMIFRLYNDAVVSDKSNCAIYNTLSKLWNDLNIQDADDECAMIDSYCKALGFMLTNDMSKRYFVCLYSKIKGWGKTAFTNLFLTHTNGVYSQYGQKKSVNQFSMSNIAGNDFYQIDDITLSNQTEMCGIINNVVSNFTTNSERKGRDEEYITDVICRMILTTNIPFMPRDDTFGLCDNKMIEITSNVRDDLSLNESKLVAHTLETISAMSQSEYDKFFNLCVQMYVDDDAFITRHLRINKARDEVLDTSIADTIDFDEIKRARAGCKLSDVLKYNYRCCSERYANKDDIKSMRIAYSKVCDTLDRKFNLKPCSLASDKTSIYSRSYGVRDKRNFILNDEAIDFLHNRLIAFTGADAQTNNELSVFNGDIEDLFHA